VANLASGKEQGTNETTKPTKQVVNIGKSMVAKLELSTQQSLHPSPGQRLDNRIQLSFNGSIMLLCALMPTNSTIDHWSKFNKHITPQMVMVNGDPHEAGATVHSLQEDNKKEDAASENN
jgi:hypothetical protein